MILQETHLHAQQPMTLFKGKGYTDVNVYELVTHLTTWFIALVRHFAKNFQQALCVTSKVA